MGHRDNLSKRKFNRWTVLDFSHVKHGAIYWNCKCECGTLKTIHANTLRNGDSKSCGCLRDEIARASKYLQLEYDKLEKCYKDNTGKRCDQWDQRLTLFRDFKCPRRSC